MRIENSAFSEYFGFFPVKIFSPIPAMARVSNGGAMVPTKLKILPTDWVAKTTGATDGEFARFGATGKFSGDICIGFMLLF
ncbi:hypothetical protein A3A67_01070 [Candidatus Peribacteria bacterium RIFCSPLOWO2_01_FULL_51_18]|nr:MAG: hypothetical protein A3A67_01070 [Candidatus Peribacteria bacterium RIFCSPLOWO2_01_FULL_51_18]